MPEELIRDLMLLSPEGISLFSAYIAALENQDTHEHQLEQRAEVS